MERQIRAWLKAGIIDGDSELFPAEGTPQGGVISPLLSNIALHEMEEMLMEWVERILAYNPGGTIPSKSARRSRLTVVRYADDFVVLHPELEIIKEAKERISKWLEPISLELHPEKTSIKHTYLRLLKKNASLEDLSFAPGFQFLGFWIRNYTAKRREEGKRLSGYKTYIRPHPDKSARVLQEIRKVLSSTRDVKVVVKRLKPIITGWSNYF